MKRFTIDIPKEFHKELKLVAAASRTTMKQLALDAIAYTLKRRKKSIQKITNG